MKNTQKGFIVPLLIAIVAVLVIGGGIYVFEKSKTEPVSQETADNQVVSTSSTQTNIATNQTANWKTYANAQYGFSFKYPKEWGNAYATAYDISSTTNKAELEIYGDLSNVAKKSLVVNFDGNDQHAISVQIKGYDATAAIDILCDEGTCDRINMLDEKKQVTRNSNITVDGIKGEIIDGYSNPGSSFTRVYEFYLPTYRLKISDWYLNYKDSYSADNLLKYTVKNITENRYSNGLTVGIDLNDVIKINQGSPYLPDFEQFLSTIQETVSTFKFTK